MKIILILMVVGLVIAAGSYFNPVDRWSSNDVPSVQTAPIVLETSMGKIGLELVAADAPKTVANFLKLTTQGFYNGLTFHRVIPGFMIQGGDPNCGKNGKAGEGPCGAGGPGYQFADEIYPALPLYKTGYKRGVVAMANSGPNTNGSQFFIMVGDTPLPSNYTIFGHVVFGQDVANQISLVKRGGGDRPIEPVTIVNVVVTP